MGNKTSQSMSWGTWCCCFLCTLTVNVVLATNTSCPTWHYYNNATGQCECGAGLVCSNDGHQAEIGNGMCATSPGEEGYYYVGGCPFIHTSNSMNRLYSETPSNASKLDEVMCGPYNRRGFLCGERKNGYGPAVYSFNLKCAKCSSTWSGYAISLYLFLQFVPTTLIFICSMVSRLKITSGPLLGYLIFCQSMITSSWYRQHFIYDYIQSNMSKTLQALLLFSLTVSQFPSLQFFKAVLSQFCISKRLTGIHILMMNFIPITYVFALVIISSILTELHARNYRIVAILWKPFSIILSKAGITEVSSNAVFHAFALLIFLSNIYVQITIQEVASFINVYNSTKVLQKSPLC